MVSKANKEQQVKKYDFRSPKKFGKEQQRTIESLHENFARSLTTHLTSLTRVVCEIHVEKIEEQRYYEYSNAIDENTIMTNFEILPLDQSMDEATMLINFEPTFGFYMIDKLLGGSGKMVDLKREYTEIELTIFDSIFSKMNRSIESSWSKHLELDAMLKSIETNPRLVQVMAPEDIVMNVSFGMTIDHLQTQFSVCMSALSLEKMMECFTPKFSRSTKKQDMDKEELQKQAIMDNLQAASVELTATLDELDIDLHDILQLQVGDVIPLTKRFDSNITISANNTPWFEAKLGETKTRKAVKISQLMEQER